LACISDGGEGGTKQEKTGVYRRVDLEGCVKENRHGKPLLGGAIPGVRKKEVRLQKKGKKGDLAPLAAKLPSGRRKII